jgi:predicted ester cyclase
MMPDQTNESKALLQRITEDIWTKGRLDLIDELISDDFVDHIDFPGIDEVGRARYRASVEAMHTAFPDYREEILWSVAEEDRAVSYTLLTGTHQGPLYGMEPTGRKVEYNAMGALRFESGMAVERWGFGDSMVMMQQLGLL